MERFISYGSISDFNTVIKDIKKEAQYLGFDNELQKPKIDIYAELPIIKATVSEKVHGSNGSVCYNNEDGLWYQSRKNIITPEKDNLGCAFACTQNKKEWMKIILDLANEYDIDLHEKTISIYFEWGGGSIQKKSCLSGLDKRALIFQYFKVSPNEPKLDKTGQVISAFWLKTQVEVRRYKGEYFKKHEPANGNDIVHYEYVDNKEANIFNVMNFQTDTINIDFNEPLLAKNKIIEMINKNEKNSPIGQAFGVEGNILEGYVLTFEYKGNIHRFKVKGELHSSGTGKVKTLKPVNEELENKKIKFVNEIACTESRLDQMYTEIIHTKHNGDFLLMDMKDLRDYLVLVYRDVIKENSEEMAEVGLEPKQINSMVSKVAVSYFRSRLDKEVM